MKLWRLAPLWVLSIIVVVLALSWFVFLLALAQDPATELLTLINNARIARGLHPYVTNSSLTAAAQRHSQDMQTSGRISHSGSDGSSSTQRMLEAGYGVYEFGPLVSENIYVGSGGADVPFRGWMDQPDAQANLLHEKYREVGIGVASDAQGRRFWTLNVGAQPNVLPVLINDGAASVDTVTVTLRLVPENVVPQGLGTAMGQPVEYRASTSSQFPGADWRPWADQVLFVLDETPGQQTVYVQLRDASGRTAISQDSVALNGLEITPTGSAVGTQEGTAVHTLTRTVVGTPTGTSIGSPTATVARTRTPTPGLSPSPTLTRTATPITTATTTPSLTPAPSATLTPTDLPSPTSLPTSTPRPTASRTVPPSSTPTLNPIVPMATGISPPSASGERKAETESQPLASRVAPWALGLQVIAVALGIYVALRRPGAAQTLEAQSFTASDDDVSSGM